MLASEVVNALTHIIATSGNHKVNISIAKPPESDPAGQQRYLMAEPTTITLEEYDDGKQVSIRDWPY